MNKILKYSCFLISFWNISLNAQDFHLSQYDAAPQYLNPALTGTSHEPNADYKIYTNYRAQWRSILPKPFATYSLGGESFKNQFGYGGFVIANNSGAGNLNTLNVLLSGAYRIIKDESSKHHLNVGVQLGVMQRSFNPAALNFENQYSIENGGFNSNLPNGENFTSLNILKFDAGMGISYSKLDTNTKCNYSGGFAIFHVTNPLEQIINEKYLMPMRFVLHGNVTYQMNEKFYLIPNMCLMYQAAAKEINIGCMTNYYLRESMFAIGGISYRNKDALILHLGLKHKTNYYRFSYDINTSKLNSLTSGRGATEFSIIYTFKKPVKASAASLAP